MGVLNIKTGETIVNSKISDKAITVQGYNATANLGGTGITNIADGATLTLGKGATITQKEINVAGALYAENSGTLTGKLSIADTGVADLNAGTLTSTVYNDGDITLRGDGTLSQNIEGSGVIGVWGGSVVNNALIKQTTFEIGEEFDQNDNVIPSSFTTNIDNLIISDKVIHNAGTLKLTGGTNIYEITSVDTDGDYHAGGKTVVAGNVTNNGLISQSIEIQSGSLTTAAEKLSGNVTNSGVLNVTGKSVPLTEEIISAAERGEFDDSWGSHLTVTVSGDGKTVLNNNIFIDKNIETELEIKGIAQTEQAIGKSGKNITLKSDAILFAEANSVINGKLNIENNALAMVDSASSLKDETVNNGRLVFGIGTLSKNVTGNGTTAISGGTVINEAIIKQANLEIDYTDSQITTPAVLVSNADNLKISDGIINAGTLKLTGGTLTSNVTNLVEDGNTYEGVTEIAGEVVNNAKISQNVNVTSGYFESNADNVTGVVDVASGASYDIFSGALRANSVSGNGTLVLSDIVTSAPLDNFYGEVNITETGVLTLANNTDVFANADSVKLENGSTLSLLGAANNVVMNNLVVSSEEHVVNLKFDWGDKLNAKKDDVKGTLKVTEINMASTDGTEDSYPFTNLGDRVALAEDMTLSNVSSSTNNFVKYNNSNGYLFSKQASLAIAVDATESTETNSYVMLENESAGNEVLEGSLTIQGSGNSITDGGIIVGSSTSTNNTLTLKDVGLSNITADAKGQKGAIHVNGGNEIKLVAETKDTNIGGTKGNSNTAIYLQKDEKHGVAKATINATGGKIAISDDIMSDDKNNEVRFTGNREIHFSGRFDPVKATVDMSDADLIRSGQDEDIDWNLNGGTLRYTQDSFLSNGTNSVNFNGGSLDLRNGAVNTIDLSSLTLSNNSNLYLDVDLKNETMDRFDTDTINVANTSAKLHVAGLNLISDATKDLTVINFVPKETGLTGYVDYTGGQNLTALSPIYKYNVKYDDKTGDFNFSRFATGGYNDFNSGVFASPVAAQIGGYLTQLNSYDQAFRNMDMLMLMTKKERQAYKLRNKYATLSDGMLYDDDMHDYTNAWFRPYTTFESVGLRGGAKVDNIAYGSFFGGESPIVELGHGWDGMWGVYVGYNGSHQSYDNTSIYQNGGTLGLVGMAYKNDFFTGLTLNAGAGVGSANTIFGNEDFAMLMSGVASKTGYNWELADGKFIIQPSLLMSYSFVNTFNYTNAAGSKIDADPLNAITFEPGIKFIGNLKNGWQPYAGVSVVWNAMDKTKYKVNDVSLPELSVKPYVRYGVGVRKSWGEKFTGFFQTFITNGGRNGVGLQAGFTWAIGKDPSNGSSKKTGNKPVLPKTKITLNNNK